MNSQDRKDVGVRNISVPYQAGPIDRSIGVGLVKGKEMSIRSVEGETNFVDRTLVLSKGAGKRLPDPAGVPFHSSGRRGDRWCQAPQGWTGGGGGGREARGQISPSPVGGPAGKSSAQNASNEPSPPPSRWGADRGAISCQALAEHQPAQSSPGFGHRMQFPEHRLRAAPSATKATGGATSV